MSALRQVEYSSRSILNLLSHKISYWTLFSESWTWAEVWMPMLVVLRFRSWVHLIAPSVNQSRLSQLIQFLRSFLFHLLFRLLPIFTLIWTFSNGSASNLTCKYNASCFQVNTISNGPLRDRIEGREWFVIVDGMEWSCLADGSIIRNIGPQDSVCYVSPAHLRKPP